MFSTLTKYSRLGIILLLVIFTSTASAQQQLSNAASISILTCSKGDDLYNTFGHTAIHIQDKENGIDVVFNYGMFSFGGSSFQDQLTFGTKFVRGKLDYWLGLENFDDFVRNYQYQERWVYAQVLALDQSEKQHLFNALMINFEPENRAYQYDFFFDNCSSRVRDILVDAVGPVFGEDNSAIHQATDQSFIDLIHPYIVDKPWLDLGMDVMLGLPSSRKASKYEFMFLPYHLMDQISQADGLVSKEYFLIDFPNKTLGTSKFHLFTPLFFFTLLFFLIAFITYRNYKRNVHWFFIDRILLFLSGLFGCLFLGMWLGTDHLPAHANLNMFWAFPPNIIGFLFLKSKKMGMYWRIALGFSGFILLAWFLSPQQYHVAIIPLVLTFILRYSKLIQFNEEAKEKLEK